MATVYRIVLQMSFGFWAVWIALGFIDHTSRWEFIASMAALTVSAGLNALVTEEK
jgi:hypothetical protein